MKRILLATATSALLALAAPGIASAHHAKRHHHAHKHAARARVLDFRAAASPTPATTPATPTAGESAGTVTSFEKGILTITLTDKTVVSGQVTEKTEIQCHPATPSTGGDDQGSGDDENGAASGEHGSPGGDGSGAKAHDSSSGDDGEDGGSSAPCTTAALVPGAVVHEAELSVSGSGAVWDKVDLIQ
jgi:hypothetical protein